MEKRLSLSSDKEALLIKQKSNNYANLNQLQIYEKKAE